MNEPETGHSPERVADDWRSPSHMQAIVLIVATALGIFVCYRLAVPFLPALAWALALAILFTPLNRWIESKMAHPSVAAAISVVVVALIVAAPATFVGQRLVAESARGAEMIKLRSSPVSGAAPSKRNLAWHRLPVGLNGSLISREPSALSPPG
jgi:hypothetical protein